MASPDETGWIQTFTGRKVHPLALRPQDIVPEDIAHALALQCRFTGHCRWHYSVAQHSLLLALAVPVELQLWGLLHDAPEAYLNDVARPVKHRPQMAFYREAEAAITLAVCERFGLDPVEPPQVKAMDRVMLTTEIRDLMSPPHPESKYTVANGYAALPAPITEWTPREAEFRYLAALLRLTAKLPLDVAGVG